MVFINTPTKKLWHRAFISSRDEAAKQGKPWWQKAAESPALVVLICFVFISGVILLWVVATPGVCRACWYGRRRLQNHRARNRTTNQEIPLEPLHPVFMNTTPVSAPARPLTASQSVNAASHSVNGAEQARDNRSAEGW